jgi:hypothetical protein
MQELLQSDPHPAFSCCHLPAEWGGLFHRIPHPLVTCSAENSCVLWLWAASCSGDNFFSICECPSWEALECTSTWKDEPCDLHLPI